LSDSSPTLLRILTVCSHNRTRSVMMAALFESMLSERLGQVAVRSSGFGPEGIPAIEDAVEAMKRRGLDVSHHRSRSTTAALVDGADVIITAERAHVVKVAALSPSAFARAMTLPELLARAADAPLAPDGGDVRGWVESLTADRSAGAYLRGSVPEVADPTGSIPRVFEAAVATIERQCGEVSALLARIVADN
jgi:low molecular weight protein-tyrosine phosphatase